ncbi:MAG: hypothetical protein IIY89_06925, partial [Clostridia bacterium]|nr:hypothetical protein [Clostridia bacterium]
MNNSKLEQRYAVFHYNRLKLIYHLLIVLFPVLGIYTTFVPSVNLGELLLMAAFPFLFLGAPEKNTPLHP